MVLSLVGAGLQFSGQRSVQQGPSMGKGIDYFSDSSQFTYGALSAFFFTISQCLVHELKVAIHYSIDTIYVALAMTLVMPSFVLGDYSAHPGRFMIDRYEMMYYAASGVLFFVFHSQLTQILCQPREVILRPEIALYVLNIAVIGTVLLDYFWLGLKFTGPQLVGICILLFPSVVFDVYAYATSKVY